MAPVKEFLEIGRIVGTHGVRGELRVECWCDTPQQLTALKRLYTAGGAKEWRVMAARPHKSLALVKLEGVEDIPAAEALRGQTLYHRRGDIPLPPGAHFIEDVLGLRVIDAQSGQEYGTVAEVLNTGANDIYRLTRPGAADVLIPVIDPIVKEVNPEAGVVRITPMPGLFEDETP